MKSCCMHGYASLHYERAAGEGWPPTRGWSPISPMQISKKNCSGITIFHFYLQWNIIISMLTVGFCICMHIHFAIPINHLSHLFATKFIIWESARENQWFLPTAHFAENIKIFHQNEPSILIIASYLPLPCFQCIFTRKPHFYTKWRHCCDCSVFFLPSWNARSHLHLSTSFTVIRPFRAPFSTENELVVIILYKW